MLARDLLRLASGLVTSARVAVREPELTAGLAALDGAACARAGTPACYRVRLVNPGKTACTLDVVVHGERDGADVPVFEERWTQPLDGGAVAERWIVTDWTGGARVVGAHPAVPLVLGGERRGAWHIEATVDSPSRERLHIEGSLLA
jgi:hypothetical protein